MTRKNEEIRREARIQRELQRQREQRRERSLHELALHTKEAVFNPHSQPLQAAPQVPTSRGAVPSVANLPLPPAISIIPAPPPAPVRLDQAALDKLDMAAARPKRRKAPLPPFILDFSVPVPLDADTPKTAENGSDKGSDKPKGEGVDSSGSRPLPGASEKNSTSVTGWVSDPTRRRFRAGTAAAREAAVMSAASSNAGSPMKERPRDSSPVSSVRISRDKEKEKSSKASGVVGSVAKDQKNKATRSKSTGPKQAWLANERASEDASSINKENQNRRVINVAVPNRTDPAGSATQRLFTSRSKKQRDHNHSAGPTAASKGSKKSSSAKSSGKATSLQTGSAAIKEKEAKRRRDSQSVKGRSTERPLVARSNSRQSASRKGHGATSESSDAEALTSRGRGKNLSSDVSSHLQSAQHSSARATPDTSDAEVVATIPKRPSRSMRSNVVRMPSVVAETQTGPLPEARPLLLEASVEGARDLQGGSKTAATAPLAQADGKGAPYDALKLRLEQMLSITTALEQTILSSKQELVHASGSIRPSPEDMLAAKENLMLLRKSAEIISMKLSGLKGISFFI
jgi:hypothetical protein